MVYPYNGVLFSNKKGMNYWDATTQIHLKRTVLYKQARLAGVGDSRGKGKDIHTHTVYSFVVQQKLTTL